MRRLPVSGTRPVVIVAATFLLATCTPWPFVGSQVPSDAVTNACTVQPSALASWFADGHVAPNAAVTPDSIDFPPDPAPDCAFFDWSERMFLWLTSPAPSSYGGSSPMVFASPVFFTVSPPDANNQRTMKRIVSGVRSMIFTTNVSQNGPHDFPLIRAKSGTLYELAPIQRGPNKLEEVRDRNGVPVEVARAVVAPGHKVSLFDRAGHPILLPAAPPRSHNIATAQSLTIGGVVTAIDLSGTVIETEQAQSDSSHSVLMAQNGSLVYYTIAVNDVYAYFKTGVHDGGITDLDPTDTIADHFPDSDGSIERIEDYAAAHNHLNQTVAFPDHAAIAVELKMAWVEAVNLPPGCDYITMQATIPVYSLDSQTHPTEATPTGTRTATLALIAMHVVGSAIGQPAMIWATFEHVCNAPTVPYYYASTGTGSSPSETGYWLLSSSDNPGSPNVRRIALDPMAPGSLKADPGLTIGPSDIRREMPWGMAPTNYASNANVITANYSVRSQIGTDDIRWNYIQTGTTWYEFTGLAPTGGIWPLSPNGAWNVTTHGTVHLASTAIETFLQGDTPGSSLNCLDCHTNPEHDTDDQGHPINRTFLQPGNLGFPYGGGVSHIWGDLIPLP